MTKPNVETTKSAIRVLQRAQKLIVAGWTQGASARRKNGDDCAVMSKSAARFCASGARSRACCKISDWPVRDLATSALQAAVPGGFGGDIIKFNDSAMTKKSHVVALFQRAIDSLRSLK